MGKLKKKPDKSAGLRKKAEKKLNTQLERLKELSAKGAHELAQELGTHQIELEMQIEELQRAQEELEASRSKYSDLYDFAPVGYLTFDASGVVREANLTAAKMLGIERQYLLNKPFSGFLSKDDNDAFRLHCVAILENRTKQAIEVRLKRRDKTEFFALLESVVVEDPEGNAVAILTAASDITERRRAEETLQKSELRYRSLFENMLDGYAYCRMLYDDRGRPTDFVYLSVNSAFERLTGLKDVVGMKVTDVIPGIRESHPKLLETCGRVAATGRTEKFEIEFKPLGIWLSISVYSTERDHFSAVFDNITERKNAAFVLGRSEEKYRLLFENMAEGFALYELVNDDTGKPADWRVLEVNDAYVLHTGVPRDRIVGRRMSDLFPSAIPEYLPRFAEVVASQKATEFEIYRTATNRHQHVVCFPAGPGRFASTITDITERKRAEEALRQSREDMARAQVVGQIGSWRLDVRQNVLTWSDENHHIFGIPKGTPLTYETFLSTIHPDDREYVDTRWKAGLRGEPYDIEHRIIADAMIKWVREKAYLEFGKDGELLGGFGITQDVTERKRAEEALQKAHAELEIRVEERTRELSVANESVRTERQRLFSVLETLPVYVILLTQDHQIPFANRFFRERFGDTGGRRCYEYLFNRAEPCETCETYTVLRTNAPHHWYWTGPDKRDYDIYDFPFIDSDGTTMILEMGIDITDQKKAQQALRETISELQDATRRAEFTNSLLALITQKNTRREYLDATCDLFQRWSGMRHAGVRVTGPNRKIPFESCRGYDPAFLAQESDLSLAEDQCICTRIIAGTPCPPDLRSMTPKGSFYSGDMLAFVDHLADNERSRYRGTCMKYQYRSLAVIPILYRENPVGAIHLADERPGMLHRTTVEFLEQLAQIVGEAVYRFGVEEERIRLASALESSADGVAITNSKNGKIEYVNRAFEQITGYAKSEAIGSNLHLLDSGKHDEAFYHELRAALARDGVWRGVLINRKKDGMLYYEECSFSPVLGPDGSILNYVSIKRDITEKLRLESIAESVNSMNNIGYIFAGVRHEIGNPINSAKMMLSVLQLKLDTATTDVIKSYVDRSLVEIGRVENLLRNLKNFNLYETPALKDLHMPSFMREFQNLVVEDLRGKGISFSQDIEAGADRARIDPRALQQVLINLVTNAADAVAGRKDPSIKISVWKEPGLLHIEVTDNGAGLTERQQQDLFKPFYTSKQHGTGLGLVIVKKLLTRMNCDISVTSVPDQGTIVDITVPEGGR